jgi:hypothetical protein
MIVLSAKERSVFDRAFHSGLEFKRFFDALAESGAAQPPVPANDEMFEEITAKGRKAGLSVRELRYLWSGFRKIMSRA